MLTFKAIFLMTKSKHKKMNEMFEVFSAFQDHLPDDGRFVRQSTKSISNYSGRKKLNPFMKNVVNLKNKLEKQLLTPYFC